jgi:hypothetical protein
LTLVALAAILNLAKIKISFALDKTTGACQARKYNLTPLESNVN